MPKKKITKSEENKTHQFLKTWLAELSFDTINLYKKNTLGIFYWWHFIKKMSDSWIYVQTNFLEVHWRCLQNIALQNLKTKKTLHSSKICTREFTFHTIHLFKYSHSLLRETIPLQTSDMGKITVSVLPHSFVLLWRANSV